MWNNPYAPEDIAEIALCRLDEVTKDLRPKQPAGELIYLLSYLSNLASFYESEPEGEFAHHARVDRETVDKLRAAATAARTLTDKAVRDVLYRIASQARPDQAGGASTGLQTTETSDSAVVRNEENDE